MLENTQLLLLFYYSSPDFLFHLAAQPLIIESYLKPHKTIDVNVGGTLNILEASKNYAFVKSVVMITSDKCYENLSEVI